MPLDRIGLQISLLIPVTVVIVVEFLSSNEGLGYVAVRALSNQDLSLMFAAIFTAIGIGLAFSYLVDLGEWLLMPWVRVGRRWLSRQSRETSNQGRSTMPIENLARKLAVLSAVGLLALAWGAPRPRRADHMKMTFNWVADTGYIPFLYADQLGYYKDAGIEMEFEQGRGSMVTSQLIAQGKADVGYANSGAAISVASKGGPIKIIAVINQANSYGLVSLANSGIKTPPGSGGQEDRRLPGLRPGAAARRLHGGAASRPR